MSSTNPANLVSLDTSQPIWQHFFTVSPLIVVGTKEATEGYDLAPKHMAMPLGWDNYFTFVCTPRHRTYQNIQREQTFTVSFPYPEQVVLASLTATPHCDDRTSPILDVLPTISASVVDGMVEMSPGMMAIGALGSRRATLEVVGDWQEISTDNHTVLCASDPYSVLGATHSFHLTPDLISGIVTDTTAGVELVEKLTEIPAICPTDDCAVAKLMPILQAKLQRSQC